MADRDVKIAIQTVADTTGAKDAQQAFAELEAEVKRLQAEVKRMSKLLEDANNNPLKRLPKNTEDAGKGMRQMGMLANQASYQLGDFFTQIEMGTGMVRAFSQQAPQLIGAVSMAGVVSAKTAMTLAGIGAAIPIAAIALPMLSEALLGTADAASSAGDEYGKVLEVISKTDIERIDKANRAIVGGMTNAKALRLDLSNLTTAENEYSLAALGNAQNLRTAQENLNVVLGIRVDKYRQIREAENAEKALRDERERQEIAKQQAAIAKQEQELEDKKAAFAANQAKADALATSLAATREKKYQLDVAQQGYKSAAEDAPKAMDWIGSANLKAGKTPWDVYERGQSADMAARNAESVGKLAEAVGKSVETLKTELDKLKEPVSGTLAQQAAEVAGMANQLESDRQALSINLSKISETAKVGDFKAKSDEAVQVSSQLASDAQSMVSDFTTGNAKVQAQIEVLKAAIPNGIDLKEIPKVAKAMSEIAMAIRIGFADTTSHNKEILQTMATYQAELQRQKISLESLKATR